MDEKQIVHASQIPETRPKSQKYMDKKTVVPPDLPVSPGSDCRLVGSFLEKSNPHHQTPLKPNAQMKVMKRDGSSEPVSFNEILIRIQLLSSDLSGVNCELLTKKVIEEIYDGIQTSKLDELASEIAISMVTAHPDYGVLATRIEVSNLHKNTDPKFSVVIRIMWDYVNPHTHKHTPLVSKKIFDLVTTHAEVLNSSLQFERDFDFDYFGIKTLMKSYLFRIEGRILERPQHMFMRTALEIHRTDLEAVLETYDLLSKKFFIHATPTLFNSCTPHNQLASCFLLKMKEDSIEGIFETLGQCAKISKHCGGIGLNISTIRARNSYIRGTNGYTNGTIPMLRIFNELVRYVDQGGGKRKGSIAVYLEPWHRDVTEFLLLKKNTGKDEERCRDLFLALWMPDLFMKRVLNDGDWSLMCPDQCPGLCETFGEEFENLYMRYEQEKKFIKRVKARKIWRSIIQSQIETGQPFILYKDSCNKKSNQKNIGVISSSNLCTEVVQYTAKDEIAVCVLASLALPKFVDTEKSEFDFEHMGKIVKKMVLNLNRVIDHNKFPLLECENSSKRHRSVGLGVQGLADVFMLLKLPFDSQRAKKLNREIFESIYFHALEMSCDLAKQESPYRTFHGSPASQGKLQFDLWNENPTFYDKKKWDHLKQNIKNFGLRNSLLIALMPTASTSQILGNNEACEPYTSNLYIRRTLAGEFIVLNKHLVRDLVRLGLWSENLKDKIVRHNGSVQNIPEIPSSIRNLYKTVWELKQKDVIDMYIGRAPFVDQSQSMNIHIKDPTYQKLSSIHFYNWRNGLKTGMYYLRTQPAADAIKFTLSPEEAKKIEQNRDDQSSSKFKNESIHQNPTPPSCPSSPSQECLLCSS